MRSIGALDQVMVITASQSWNPLILCRLAIVSPRSDVMYALAKERISSTQNQLISSCKAGIPSGRCCVAIHAIRKPVVKKSQRKPHISDGLVSSPRT